VDGFVDKIIHRWRTGDTQAVGKLVGEKDDDKGLIQKNFSSYPRRPQAL
jgi:hypothetical protein